MTSSTTPTSVEPSTTPPLHQASLVDTVTALIDQPLPFLDATRINPYDDTYYVCFVARVGLLERRITSLLSGHCHQLTDDQAHTLEAHGQTARQALDAASYLYRQGLGH